MVTCVPAASVIVTTFPLLETVGDSPSTPSITVPIETPSALIVVVFPSFVVVIVGVSPFSPSGDKLQLNFFSKFLPSTTIGTFKVPFLVVNVVLAFTVKEADVVPLLEIEVVKPVT